MMVASCSIERGKRGGLRSVPMEPATKTAARSGAPMIGEFHRIALQRRAPAEAGPARRIVAAR
jgi:hypothetical protein